MRTSSLLQFFWIYWGFPRCRKQHLQFKPAIEDIRREYYARLRKFLSLPIHFKGFLEQPGAPSIFPKIVVKHSSRFSQVYASSSKIFGELDELKERFKIWIAPALVDLDALVEHELTEPQDWNLAFQAAKKKKEEMSSLSRYYVPKSVSFYP